MEIIKILNGDELTLQVKGELNVANSNELEKVISDSLEGIKKLIFDFSELNYISSSGLRVLLIAQKIMLKQGQMIVRGCNEDVMDIFTITGFKDILNIQ